MKNYKVVVAERFNKESDSDAKNSIYSESHPIGAYSRRVFCSELQKLVNWYTEKGKVLQENKLMDIGCGSGKTLSIFASHGFDKKNMTGIDLSETRINRGIKTHPEINFFCKDALSFKLENRDFDLITAFDLFSHLTTKQQIIEGLSNVRNHLNEEGLFLWYDIYSKDHFDSPENVESSGFSKDQMIQIAEEAGFKVVYSKKLFKLFFNRFHSIYQAKRIPFTVLRMLETILPGSPGNLMLVFEKCPSKPKKG